MKTIGKKTLEKIRYLDAYLKRECGTTLSASINEKKLEGVLSGERRPTLSILSKIASFFAISVSILLDDDEDLPNDNILRSNMEKRKIEIKAERDGILSHKHYIALNWNMLSLKRRRQLIASTLLITIPLLIYISFCISTVLAEKSEKYDEYIKGSDETYIYDQYSSKQRAYHDELLTTSKEEYEGAHYTTVKIGTVLEKMKNIDSSTSSYEARLQLYFKFDKDEFRDTFRYYARAVLSDQIINEYYIDNPDEKREKSINYKQWIDSHEDYFESWIDKHDSEYYPGEASSNVLVDKNTMFDIGNGEIVADTYGTIKDLEEVQYVDENGNLRTMCYQKVKFNGLFEKGFDSARYPLDSVQFKMYITPTMDAEYIRYVPDRDVNSVGERLSGFTPYFSLLNGYRLIREDSGMKNFMLRINYLKATNNDPAIDYPDTIKTQLEIIVRANRQGISLFLKAFINLFSVVIWIMIAFYSQAFTGEDSIGMLGTGLFGVISSMLVGLSLVSDAGIFSLSTMINIFTLAVIMIMTYQSIAAKRAKAMKNKADIAYNGIKLRLLFYVLSISTVVMFFILPSVSYMWKL